MASSILFQLHLLIPIPDLAIPIPSNSGIGIEGNSNSNSGIGPNPGGQGISIHGIWCHVISNMLHHSIFGITYHANL